MAPLPPPADGPALGALTGRDARPGRTIDRWLAAGDVRAAARIRTVADARRRALRRLPAPVAGYLEGGAGTEATLTANLTAVAEIGFVPDVGASDGTPPDLRTTVLGTELAVPFLLGPIGFSRMLHPTGDVAAATAAGALGTVSTLSSMSGHAMPEVRTASAGPTWFQLYQLGGRTGAERLVGAAADAGFDALVVTLDTQIPGDRRREARYGLSPPLVLDARTVRAMAPYAALRPRWLAATARDGFALDLVNAALASGAAGPEAAADALLRWIGEPATWSDLTRWRDRFDGPVVAKGILSAADARRAVDAGADAVVVSNHGGRQLDGVPASFRVLGEVVDAVGAEVDVLVDGGVRSGADVVRGLALGARAVLVGRAWAYGLGAAGPPGVARVLQLLREDVDRTLRLLGVGSVADLDGSVVTGPTR